MLFYGCTIVGESTNVNAKNPAFGTSEIKRRARISGVSMSWTWTTPRRVWSGRQAGTTA